ncbi:unnamed protein product [Lactuca saligna]|uniref:Uncharacterized protein n=1 Tax=Lactuca saligna TaxID=75948 RepID=A0AA35ZIS9_LACSI|nr:unnamed protein product [Lactuca saligna]
MDDMVPMVSAKG